MGMEMYTDVDMVRDDMVRDDMVRDDMVRDKDSQRHGMDKDMDMGMDARHGHEH